MQPERTSGSFPGVQADKKDFNCLNVDSQEKKILSIRVMEGNLTLMDYWREEGVMLPYI